MVNIRANKHRWTILLLVITAGLLIYYFRPPYGVKAEQSVGGTDTVPATSTSDQLACDPDTSIVLARESLETGQSPEEARETSKVLRCIVLNPGEHSLEAMMLLIQMNNALRLREYPQITDEEFEASFDSVGKALFSRGERENAIKALIQEAWLLNSSAQMLLAIMYENTIEGYQQYDKRILDFYQKSAREGSNRSQYMLGKSYLYGWGVPVDPAHGIELLESSALEEAYMALAGYSYKSNNPGASENYFKLAAVMGNSNAHYNLAIFAQKRREHADMVSHLKEALEIDPENYKAVLELARAYIDGQSVEKDTVKAFRMMMQVADSTDGRLQATAQANIGMFYLQGVGGVQRSIETAREYIEKAAAGGVEIPPQVLKRMGYTPSEQSRS